MLDLLKREIIKLKYPKLQGFDKTNYVDIGAYLYGAGKIFLCRNASILKGAMLYGESDEEVAIRLAENVQVREYTYLHAYGGHIFLGKNSSVAPYSLIYGNGGVNIGDNCMIANHCSIVAFNHNFSDNDSLMIDQGLSAKGIVIGDDVWIGAHVTILDGVKVGNGVILGAGSVVTKNIEDYAIAMGTPAKVVKFRRKKDILKENVR